MINPLVQLSLWGSAAISSIIVSSRLKRARPSQIRIGFVPLLIICGLWPICGRASTVDDELNAAARTYYQGHVAEAIKALKVVADQELTVAPSPEGKSALEYLLDICVGAWDFQCLKDYSPKYTNLVLSLKDVPDQLKLPFALQTAYYRGFTDWLIGNHDDAELLLKQWADSNDLSWMPREYIRRQLMRARLNLVLDHRDAARLCPGRPVAHGPSVPPSSKVNST